MLAGAIGRAIGHRPRPIESDQCNNALEPVRPHVEERPPHSLAFQLEDADRLGTRQHGVGFFVVEWNGSKIDIYAALAQEAHRRLEHSERLEAEKVELEQSC